MTWNDMKRCRKTHEKPKGRTQTLTTPDIVETILGTIPTHWGFLPLSLSLVRALQVPFWVLIPPAALTLSRHHSRPREMLRPTVYKVKQCTAQVYQKQTQSFKDALEWALWLCLSLDITFQHWKAWSPLFALTNLYYTRQQYPGAWAVEFAQFCFKHVSQCQNFETQNWFVYSINVMAQYPHCKGDPLTLWLLNC